MQLYKNYNSRELIRKINQFSLLRTNNLNQDMFVIAIIFDSDFQVTVQYFRKILKRLLEFMNNYTFKHDDESYIATNLISLLKRKYELTNLGILEFVDRLENVVKSYKTYVQMDEMERVLLDLYSNYSATKLSNSDEFVDGWRKYIESGFISEVQIDS